MLTVGGKKSTPKLCDQYHGEQRLMSAELEMKSQFYSVGHYLLKSTGADFEGDGELDISIESFIFQNKNTIGNLKRDMLEVF